MSRPVVALTVLLVAAALVPAAGADRRPTGGESSAIRAAALRSLHGAGWSVSGIRVSTVRTRNRYARASVTSAATGVGGEMLLGTRSGRWRRLFLGTDGFCDAPLPRAALNDLGFACAAPRLTAATPRILPGEELVLRGRGFEPRRTVTLSAGPPQSEADRIGAVRAGAAGTFTFATMTSPSATPGTYVVVACQRGCAVKATARVTIAAP